MTIYNQIVNNPLRTKIGDFLNNSIVDQKFIFINFWSIIHLMSGAFLMFLIDKLKIVKSTKDKYLFLFILLVIYEVAEFIAYNTLTDLFIVEKTIDLTWDLIIGMLGGFIYLTFGRSSR